MDKGKLVYEGFGRSGDEIWFPTRDDPSNGLVPIIFMVFFCGMFLNVFLMFVLDNDLPLNEWIVGICFSLGFIAIFLYFYWIINIYRPEDDLHENGILYEPYFSSNMLSRRVFLPFSEIEMIVINPDEEYCINLAADQTEEVFQMEENWKKRRRTIMKELMTTDLEFYSEIYPIISKEVEREEKMNIEKVMEEEKESVHRCVFIHLKDGNIIRLYKSRFYDVEEFADALKELDVEVMA